MFFAMINPPYNVEVGIILNFHYFLVKTNSKQIIDYKTKIVLGLYIM